MSLELTITIKDDEKRKLSKTFLIYEDVTLRDDDPIIKACLKELIEEFKGIPDDVRVKAIMVIK